MYPLHCITGGLNQNVPVTVHQLNDGVYQSVPVTLHYGWLESERARYNASANEWCESECTRYIAFESLYPLRCIMGGCESECTPEP